MSVPRSFAFASHVVATASLAAAIACDSSPFSPPPNDDPGAGDASSASSSAKGDAAAPSVDEVAIVNGVADDGRDPGVVAIDLGGQGSCSGALVAPRVVLTARHCVSATVAEVSCPATSPQIGADRDPSTLTILAGDDVASATEIATGAELVTDTGAYLCDEDLAFIILDRDVESVTPIAIAKTHPATGGYVRAVGFGKLDDEGTAGTKLLREHVRIVEAGTAEFSVGEATCQGDSGGPALDESSGGVLGVVSRGGPSCDGVDAHNVYSRLDAHADLLAAALARADELSKGSGKTGADAAPPTDVGTTCATGADCGTGVCLTDDGGSYCTRRCGTGDRCPAHYHCTPVDAGADDGGADAASDAAERGADAGEACVRVE